jgi:hypothetical protein
MLEAFLADPLPVIYPSRSFGGTLLFGHKNVSKGGYRMERRNRAVEKAFIVQPMVGDVGQESLIKRMKGARIAR